MYFVKNLIIAQSRTFYRDPNAKKLIHALKFKRNKNAAQIMAAELLSLIPNNSVLVPIPLHWTRHWARGFNQSEVIITELIKLNPSLKSVPRSDFIKTKVTPSQTKLSRSARLKNPQKAFRWQSSENPPTSIILIDDIMTTGTTLSSAAKALKLAGAKEVKGLTFAHG